jgi:hypothetical protein
MPKYKFMLLKKGLKTLGFLTKTLIKEGAK